MSELLLINGPNLNLLGTREPKLYGARTLAQIESDLVAEAERLGHRLHAFQSNHEGELIERVQKARGENVAFLLLNPGGYTHSSVALRDAVLAVAIPFVEIHLSNTHAREPFRRHSYFSDIARGVIAGFGPLGYRLALQAAHAQLAATH
ncbi:MAG TPA: type II 3-dehydroquinate dehydratase [Candidatus Binatia bacterium]|nr:type II 3-dehydroquinate dehydratase [Candidatus Binatia bacterium]